MIEMAAGDSVGQRRDATIRAAAARNVDARAMQAAGADEALPTLLLALTLGEAAFVGELREAEADGDGVEGQRQGGRERHRAAILLREILGAPAADPDRGVVADGVGRGAGLERGQIDEGFEG